MKVTLHRGITVKPEEAEMISNRILTEGINANDGADYDKLRNFKQRVLEPSLERLREKKDLSVEDVEQATIRSYPVLCACGDELGASYYAVEHNYSKKNGHTHPLIIQFTTKLSNILVDGADFLYTATSGSPNQSQEDILAKFFGTKIRTYINLARKSERAEPWFAMMLLAIQDPKIIAAHLKNRTILGGKWRTLFTSAFQVRSPIPAEDIISVSKAHLTEFTLGDYFRLG